MQKKIQQTAALLLFPMVVVGCSLTSDSKESTTPIDPPQVVKAEAVANKKSEESNEKMVTSELYFLTESNYVAPYTIQLEEKKTTEEKAKEIIQQMMEGSDTVSKLPNGFSAVLPKGSKLSALTVDKNGTATVEFSKEFLNYDISEEQQILQALTWSLTSIPEIKQVNVYANGAPLKAKGQAKTMGLTRKDGINIDISGGVDITQSMPVTVYYLMQNSDKEVFYIPVTRLVDRNDNIYQATIQELVKGPAYGSDLLGVADSSTVLKKAELKGDTLYADFNEAITNQNDASNQEVVQSIVLSLTENSPAKKVKITVNGKEAIGVNADAKDLPVERPKYVNPSKL